MKLRIIAGSLKGRFVHLPEKSLSVRPTLDRVRTSIADILQPCLAGAIAADFCAGSGTFGFEMISRGAARVDFVEIDPGHADSIRRHAATFGIEERCSVVNRDVRAHIRSNRERYDIIFFDPPYNDGGLAALAPVIIPLLSRDGILAFQRRKPKNTPMTDAAETLKPYDSRAFGDTVVELYRPR